MFRKLTTTFLLGFLLTAGLIACNEAPAPAPTEPPVSVADPTIPPIEAEPTDDAAAEPAIITDEETTADPAPIEEVDVTSSDLTEEETVVIVDDEGVTAVDKPTLDETLVDLETTELTSEEVVNLLYMREEEKLAHDVYAAFYDLWGTQIFSNISDSELSHTSAIKVLLDRYQLPDPAEGAPAGAFVNSDLQELYDTLVATGSNSLQAALEVGALIEEIDIIDLQYAIATTDNEDIKLVYENLMLGSRNHLRAFVRNLANRTDTVYAPQQLDQDSYDAIINSETERGRGQGNN